MAPAQQDRATTVASKTKKPPKEQLHALSAILTELADARQTTITEAALGVYLRALSGYDVRDVRAAAAKLEMEPRADFKPAYPELGEVIDQTIRAQTGRAASKFKPCEKIVGRGAIDQNGAECSGGYWYYWAMAYDQNGNELGMERYGRPCECLQAWRRGGIGNV